jgi:hypothetical protein
MLKKILLKKKAKAKEPSASSAINRPQLLDDAVVNNLDSYSSYLYQMLMNQLENEPIEINFPVECSGIKGQFACSLKTSWNCSKMKY